MADVWERANSYVYDYINESGIEHINKICVISNDNDIEMVNFLGNKLNCDNIVYQTDVSEIREDTLFIVALQDEEVCTKVIRTFNDDVKSCVILCNAYMTNGSEYVGCGKSWYMNRWDHRHKTFTDSTGNGIGVMFNGFTPEHITHSNLHTTTLPKIMFSEMSDLDAYSYVIQNIPLQQVEYEISYTLRRIRECLGSVSRFCEIGSYYGGSTMLYSRVLEDYGIYVTIDPSIYVPIDYKMIRKVAPYMNYQHIKLLSEDIETRKALSDVLWCNKVDCLHIDGNHDTDNVIYDFNSYLPFVREGGIILMHDIKLQSVNSAWDPYIRRGRQVEEVYEGYTGVCGIGIVYN
jgi:predicted O-methyltransferase YrrM